MSNIVLRLISKPAPPERLWAVVASGFTLAGFHLATIAQRKMELNDCCSPDLSNDRRQNDFAGYRNLNNDGVVVDAQHWADAFFLQQNSP